MPTQYQPEPAPLSIDPVLAEWIIRELRRIGDSFTSADDEVGNYQPHDADLDAISLLATQAYGRTFLTYSSEAIFKAAVNLEANIDFDPALHAQSSVAAINNADEMGITDSSSLFVWKRITWANVKTAIVNALFSSPIFQTMIEIIGASPMVKFSDSDAAAYDFWAHVNSNQFYVLVDRNGDGVWDGQHPMQLDAATDTPYFFGQKAWTQGNDGAGSGLDADLLDGLNSAATATASSIAARDASADLVARLFRTEWASLGWTGNYFVGMNANGGAGADNYMRPATPNQALTALINAGFTSAQQTITAGGALTLAHGLGVKPKYYFAFLQCVTAEGGYSIGDEIGIGNTEFDTGSNGRYVMLRPDATNINVRFGNNSTVFDIWNNTTGAHFALTNANWKLVVRALG